MLLYKEILPLKVGESNIDHRRDGVLCGSALFVCILVCVSSDVNGGFDQPFKAFCIYRCEDYWPIVIQTCHGRTLGNWDDGGGPYISGDRCLDKGGVNNQLIFNINAISMVIYELYFTVAIAFN